MTVAVRGHDLLENGDFYRNPAYSVVLLDRAAGERKWTDYDGRRRARSLRAQGNRL